MRSRTIIVHLAMVLVQTGILFSGDQKTANLLLPAELNSYSSAFPLSNSVTDIVVVGDTIWLGTGKGLSLSTDRGDSWKNFYGSPEFGEEDVSAIAVNRNHVWVATAHTTYIDDKAYPDGSGIRHSSDGGQTWSIIPQPRDTKNVDTLYYNAKSTIRALGITTTIQNITYDMTATDSAVWIASWAGMVRKSTDLGKTWHRVILPPDGLSKLMPDDSVVFDLSPSAGKLGLQQNLNHMGFAVHAEDDTIVLVGTAGGINRTTDGGKSWTKFSHQNQTSPISGNFVVALKTMKINQRNIIWAATQFASDQTEKRAVSYSDDRGQTWKTALVGEFVHNFGVKDSTLYAVSDNGIYRSADIGKSWSTAGSIYDFKTKQRIQSMKFYSSAAQGDRIWFGGNDGTAYTTDSPASPFGSQWTVVRAAQPVTAAVKTYSYPNPFSPDDEVVRLHYSTGGKSVRVTIRIFDFGMNLVRTLISQAQRSGAEEFDEIWDGRDDQHRQVANGPYFYHVQIENSEPTWGKILVIQ